MTDEGARASFTRMILVVGDDSGAEELRRLALRMAEISRGEPGDLYVCLPGVRLPDRSAELKKAAASLLALPVSSAPTTVPKASRRRGKTK